jgi:hypothetical protein
VIDDQGFLLRLSSSAEFAGSQEKAEFQWHIESGQARFHIRLGSRDVVNAIAAFGDDPADFVDAHFPTVVIFSSASRREPRSDDREDERFEKMMIVR